MLPRSEAVYSGEFAHSHYMTLQNRPVEYAGEIISGRAQQLIFVTGVNDECFHECIASVAGALRDAASWLPRSISPGMSHFLFFSFPILHCSVIYLSYRI